MNILYKYLFKYALYRQILVYLFVYIRTYVCNFNFNLNWRATKSMMTKMIQMMGNTMCEFIYVCVYLKRGAFPLYNFA